MSGTSFDFARALRDPGFRARLAAEGWHDGDAIWITEPGQNINADLAAEGAGSYLVATADDAADHGFRLCRIDIPDMPELMAEVDQLRAAVARVRALCLDLQTEGEGGGVCDADTLWPSQVLAALDGEDAT